jgi:hypothetical protein
VDDQVVYDCVVYEYVVDDQVVYWCIPASFMTQSSLSSKFRDLRSQWSTGVGELECRRCRPRTQSSTKWDLWAALNALPPSPSALSAPSVVVAAVAVAAVVVEGREGRGCDRFTLNELFDSANESIDSSNESSSPPVFRCQSSPHSFLIACTVYGE